MQFNGLSIPVSSVRILDVSGATRTSVETRDIPEPPTPDEWAAITARQQAMPTRTAFEVDGRLIAYVDENGFTAGSHADLGNMPSAVGPTGLKRWIPFQSDRVENELLAKYGDRLKVVRYEPGKEPASGEMSQILANRGEAPNKAFDVVVRTSASRVAKTNPFLAWLGAQRS